jgi:hypothetical protein
MYLMPVEASDRFGELPDKESRDRSSSGESGTRKASAGPTPTPNEVNAQLCPKLSNSSLPLEKKVHNYRAEP